MAVNAYREDFMYNFAISYSKNVKQDWESARTHTFRIEIPAALSTNLINFSTYNPWLYDSSSNLRTLDAIFYGVIASGDSFQTVILKLATELYN